MKKRLLSLLLVLAVVFSFSLSAFATDTGIDIIDDPLSYYFENQMLGVQKGTGVTLVCPKCDYKVVYTGGTLVTCPYDGEALVLADLAGVHAEKVPSGIGRKDLPGYIDNSGTAHVSKEGKLKFVAHPCWLDVGERESNKFTLTDPYKPYRVQEEDEDYGLYVYDWLGYNNGISHFSLYTQPLSDDMYYGNFDFYWIIDSGFVPGTYYVAADQPTVKNFYSKYGAEPQILKTKAGEYNLPNDSYWGLGNLGLSDYNAVWHERRWFYAENAKSTSIDIYLYADDAADPAQADSAASSDEVVVPPEEGKVVQVQGVQTYDPQLYERMDKLQESIDALTEALIPAAEGAESSAEDAGGQDYTSQLSTISGQLVSLQEAVVMSTPESAEEPNIWDKPFNEYTPLEGYALLTFVIILAACGLSIFRRF